MANTQNSYEFNLPIRDLSAEYQQLIVKQPTLIKMISVGAPCTGTKTEWLEDVLTEKSFTIASLGSDGNGTVFNIADTSNLKVGDIVKFYKSDGGDRAGLAKVTAIGSATQFTIARDYAGMTLATLAIGDTMFINDRPKNENSLAETGANRQQTSEYNYTSIIDTAYNLSNTAIAIQTYGNANVLSYQQEQALLELMWRQQRGVLSGGRVQRTSTEAGTAGGFNFFTNGGLAETTGGAITSAHINNALEKIYNASGIIGSNLALAMNTNQARKISAFNTAGTNPIVQIPSGQATTGQYVSTFIGDLPVNSGFTAPVVVDPTLPKDQIWIIDLDAIELSYLRPFSVYDATANGQDGRTERILAEYTVRMKNAKLRNCKITGLNV